MMSTTGSVWLRRAVAVAWTAAVLWTFLDRPTGTTLVLAANAQASASAQKPKDAADADQGKTLVFEKFLPPVVTRGGPAGMLELEPNQQFNAKEYREDMALTFGYLHRYWAEELPKTFGPAFAPPTRYYQYDERDRSVPQAGICNGRTLGPNNAYYCGADDSIHWHGPFIKSIFTTFGDFAASYVWAHEYGHAMQQRLGRLGPDRYTIQRELEADCLAGAWSGWAERVAKIIEPGDIDEALLTMFRLRDKVGTPWFDATAHGTAQERIRAFNFGYDQSSPKVCVVN